MPSDTKEGSGPKFGRLLLHVRQDCSKWIAEDKSALIPVGISSSWSANQKPLGQTAARCHLHMCPPNLSPPQAESFHLISGTDLY